MAQAMEIKKIGFPKVYVRDGVKPSQVEKLGELVAMANDVKSWKDLIPAKGKPAKKIHWPFAPMIVAKLSETERETPETKEGEEKKEAPVYEVVDGAHRLTLLEKLGQTETEVRIESLPDASDRFLEAFKSSSAHGLVLSKDERDSAIKTMVKKLGMKVEHVARETGLHKASISRIANSRQRKTTPHASKGKTKSQIKAAKAGKENGKGSANLADSPQAFIERLMIDAQEFKRVKESIVALFAKNQPVVSKLNTLSNDLLSASLFFKFEADKVQK